MKGVKGLVETRSLNDKDKREILSHEVDKADIQSPRTHCVTVTVTATPDLSLTVQLALPHHLASLIAIVLKGIGSRMFLRDNKDQAKFTNTPASQ